jgi:hypothetical protein
MTKPIPGPEHRPVALLADLCQGPLWLCESCGCPAKSAPSIQQYAYTLSKAREFTHGFCAANSGRSLPAVGKTSFQTGLAGLGSVPGVHATSRGAIE